jgi:WD40-like Beta Propeller Repeat
VKRLAQAAALAVALYAGLLVYQRYQHLKGQGGRVAAVDHGLDALAALSGRLRKFRETDMVRHIRGWVAACVGRAGDDQARVAAAEAYRADVASIGSHLGELDGGVWQLVVPRTSELPRLLRALDDHLMAEVPPSGGWDCADLQTVERLAALRNVVTSYASCLNEISRMDAVEVWRGGPSFDPCTPQLASVQFPDRQRLEEAEALRPHTFAERVEPLAGLAAADEIVVVRSAEWSMPALVSSPDGGRVAYVVRRDGRELVVTDGEAGPAYDRVGSARDGGFAFSADSGHVAYTAERGGKWFVVVDGVEGPSWDAVRSLAVAAGGRTAYAARRGASWQLVVDRREHSLPTGGARDLVFSADGARLAYVTEGDGDRAVVDDVPGQPYARIAGLVFSPDSQRTAYVAVTPNGKKAIVDGVDGPVYYDVGAPVFSPDSTRVAYVAQRDGRARVVVNGSEDGAYDAIGGNKPVFSPDSAHLAYVARTGNRSVVIFDGRERASHPDIRGSVVFSADSRHVAYVVRRDEQELVAVDGRPYEPAYAVDDRTLVLSADGRHVAYAAWKGGWRLAVNDAKSRNHFAGVVDRPLRFDSSTHVSGVAEGNAGARLVRLELDLPSNVGGISTISWASGVGARR